MRKNPDNKALVIVKDPTAGIIENDYAKVLTGLAIAESNLVRAGKSSAMPHFLAIIKELERVCGFKFEIMKE